MERYAVWVFVLAMLVAMFLASAYGAAKMTP